MENIKNNEIVEDELFCTVNKQMLGESIGMEVIARNVKVPSQTDMLVYGLIEDWLSDLINDVYIFAKDYIDENSP